MKPYGVTVIEHPDLCDLREMGAPSRAGGSPNGRGYARDRKRRTRRYWKRQARRDARREIVQETSHKC